MEKLRYFMDSEFMEDGARIELLSLALVCDDGREYYAANADADPSHANEWVQANVLPHLPPLRSAVWKPRAQIRDEAAAFLLAKGEPAVWGYYADYDWVLFCQLFGRMVDLPKGLPEYCLDVKQLSVMLGDPVHPPQRGIAHHALDDARAIRDLYRFLVTTAGASGDDASDDRVATYRAIVLGARVAELTRACDALRARLRGYGDG